MQRHNVIKVLVINPNNWYNKGDVSNRLGLIKALKKEFGDKVDITIETLTPEEDAKYFSKFGATVVESIFSTNINKKPFYPFLLITKIKNMIHFLICLVIYRVFRYKPASSNKCHIFLHSLLDSDIVISSPGGFLQEYNILSSLMPNLFLLASAIILRKPVVIYAQSVGPFRIKVLRPLYKLIFNRVKLVILRESISLKHLMELGTNNPNVFVTADATFSVDSPHYNMELYRQDLSKLFCNNENDIFIGITVLGDYFLHRRRRHLLKNYIKSIVTVIDYAIKELRANVILIPQVASQSEISVMRLIACIVKNKNNILTIEYDLSPEEIMKVIGCMDLLIGTRMHSNIFALVMGVPVLAIAYEHKTYGIMEMLGLRNWAADIKYIDGNKLVSKINELYKYRLELKRQIPEIVQKIKVRSLLSAKIVRIWYKDYEIKIANVLPNL